MGKLAAVQAETDSRLLQLGKFGAFPARELIGRPYDITYEIVLAPGETPLSGSATPEPESRGKKGKKSAVPLKDNPGWKHVLRPQKQRTVLDAIVDDIRETNEFIEDQEAREGLLMSQEEIAELKAQGVSAEEMIKRQMERHDQFELKTDFSKEKWRKRKEKKYSQTVHPLAPSTRNIVNHYAERNPQAIAYLREDTLSQLLVAADVRPGGRYLVVDDTGGLVTAAIAERMGCTGRIMVFTDADSPPAWGVLNTMNFSEQELACIKWLNWMEAEPGYERPPLPTEDGMPAIAAGKTQARVRRHNAQVAELTASQNELHSGNWDAAILATDLSPVSVVKKLTPYIAGAGNLVVYSPYQQVVAETLAYTRKDPNYLATNMTESWMRTYQVLPGRTHPMMTTSAAGGYLLAATRVIPSTFVPESHQRHNKRRKKANGDATPAGTDTQEE